MKTKTDFLKAKVEVKKSGDVISVIASDETMDRHGESLPISMWDLTKFKAAPRMLVDHNHQVSSIVGRWDNPRIEGKTLVMDAIFHDITQLAREVKEMVVQKFLDTVSVGFIYNEDEKGTGSFELIETSWVTVPANPSARVLALKSLEEAVTDEEVEQIKNFAEEKPSIEESDEVLPDEDEPEEEVVSDVENIYLIDSVKMFKEFEGDPKQKEAVAVECTVGFIKDLVNRSEQLETLTVENHARSVADKNAKLARLALKEAASLISHSLREFNRID